MPDGIVIRPIRPDDRHDMLAAMRDGRVSSESLYRRFHSVKPTLSARELDYLTVVDGRDHIALVAVPAGRPDHLLGIARAVRVHQDRARAEVAVIVADRHHGHGVATALMGELLGRARAAGVGQVVAAVQGDNTPIVRLMQRFGGRWSGAHGPVRELVVDLEQLAATSAA